MTLALPVQPACAPRRAWRSGARFVAAATLWASLAVGGCGGGGSTVSALDYVLDPQKVHYGGSYSDWSVMWWQWALEQPWQGHPLFDTTGAEAARNQVEPVWFIGGVFGTFFEPSSGFAERWITIPGDVALFFPILNGEYDNQYCVPNDWVPRTAAELAQIAYEGFNQARDVYCSLDGADIFRSADISGAAKYRAISGTFTAEMPYDHIGIGCNWDPAPIHLDPAVSDGLWVMLDPLPPGQHEITFGGSLPLIGVEGYFHLDIIYHITVLP